MQNTQQIIPESNQRTPEWFEMRRGKSTSSEFHKVMGVKCFGETGKTYALSKAGEIVEGISDEDSYESYDMKLGTEREPLAFKKFQELMSDEFLTVEKCDFVKLNDNTGGSPDGKVSNNSGLEIKCPKLDKFLEFVMYGAQVIDRAWMIQMQHQMWVCGTKQTYMFMYHIHNGREMWHYVIVERNEDMINIMKERQKEFELHRDECVKLLIKNRKY